MNKRRSILLALVVLLQVAVLAWVATTNARVMMFGEAVVLKTMPVDPLDPFRGEYVRLSYEVSRLDLNQVPHAPAVEELGTDDPVVLWMSQPEGRDEWKVSFVSTAENPPEMIGGVPMKGRVTYNEYPQCASCERNLHIEFGIEQFFTPQGEAILIERAPQDSITVRVRVWNGTPRIEKVLKDGVEIVY